MRRSLALVLVAAACAISMAFGGASAAVASPTGAGASSVEARPAPRISSAYSDEQILQLLFAATGPAARANPRVVTSLGFSKDRPAVDQAALRELIAEYLAFYPKFGLEVRPAVTSGDPLRVEQGLTLLTEKFQELVALKYQPVVDSELKSTTAAASKSVCSPGGWFCSIAYVAAMVNGVVYANVAVATMAVATIAVLWVYLSDGDDMGGSTTFETQNAIAQITAALANE